MSCDNPGSSVKEDVMPRRLKFGKSKDCVKCKENRGNIVIKHAVFCKVCFFPFVTAKFKKALDPYINEEQGTSRRKFLNASGNLLLGFSGGLGSTVLMDIVNDSYLSRSNLMKGGRNHLCNDRIWNQVYVCYVETCSAFHENGRDRTEEIRQVLKQYENIDLILLRIEDAFDPSWWARNGGQAGDLNFGLNMSVEDLPFSTVLDMQAAKPTEALTLYLSSLPTQTAVATSVQILIRRLLLQTAHAMEASHLLLGTSLTSLSIAHVSSIAQGGGFFVHGEAQEEWNAAPISLDASPEQPAIRSVRVIRPLRDVGMKECGVWAWWRNLRIVGRDRYLAGKQGIGALTRDFIVGLEADYPSTVSTIARTCAKVEPKEKPGGMCAMCGRPAPRDVQGWKSRISIRDYSDLADTRLPSHVREIRDASCAGQSIPTGLNTDVHHDALTPHLCYVCHTTLVSKSSRGATLSSTNGCTRSDGLVPLPVWVNAKLWAEEGKTLGHGEIFHCVKMDESSMRKAVEGFLVAEHLESFL